MLDDKIRTALVDLISRDALSLPYDFWSGQHYPIQWEELFGGEEFFAEIETEEVNADFRILGISARRIHERVFPARRLIVRNEELISDQTASLQGVANRLMVRVLMDEIITRIKSFSFIERQRIDLPMSEILRLGDSSVQLTVNVSESAEDGLLIKLNIGDLNDCGPVMFDEFFVND